MSWTHAGLFRDAVTSDGGAVTASYLRSKGIALRLANTIRVPDTTRQIIEVRVIEHKRQPRRRGQLPTFYSINIILKGRDKRAAVTKRLRALLCPQDIIVPHAG